MTATTTGTVPADPGTAPDPGIAPDSGTAAAPGYRPRRTLPLRVEAVRQLLRRRTLIAFAVMLLLPVVVWAAFAIGGTPSSRDTGPTLIDVATGSGLNFSLAVLFVASGFLLTIPVALFFGDTIASEASWSSLRYLLAAPVPRDRLLVSKLLVSLGFSAAAVLALPTVALGVGTLAYGWHDLQLTTAGSLPAGTAVQRLAIIAVYVFVSQLAVAGFAFWLSTATDAPLGAVGGAVGVAILSNILDAITALGSLRDVLPTHFQYAWADALQPHLEWAGMLQGTSVAVSFAIVFFALAFRGFRKKDIVS
jgi:ABC-2 type transport system permease protein